MLNTPTRMMNDHGRWAREQPGTAGVVLLSNRGPVEHRIEDDGSISCHRSSGGVATALASLGARVDFAWVASAMTEGDRLAAMGAGPVPVPGIGTTKLRFVATAPDVQDGHYTTFSNRVLWFLQHSMWDLLEMNNPQETMMDAWLRGYVPANLEFAKAAVRACSTSVDRPIILVQDYHLYLAPGSIRRLMPHALIQHFTHIPWPAPSAWSVLPAVIRESVLRSLLASDIVGFQTPACVENFLRCCASFLPEARVDLRASTVVIGNRLTWVRDYPISIDVRAVRRMGRSPEADNYRGRIELSCGEPTFVRVDRLDPSKNIIRGFQAFDLLLESHPELIERARFLAFLVPTRTKVPEYRAYAKEVFSIVQAINEKYATQHGGPITVYYENNYLQSLAGMSVADVMIVNSLADGMNLVSKEAPIVTQRNLALVLSRTAGAYQELASGAIGMDPFNVEEAAGALYAAATLPAVERARRAARLRNAVERHDIYAWLLDQMRDLELMGLNTRLSRTRGAMPEYGQALPGVPVKQTGGAAFL